MASQSAMLVLPPATADRSPAAAWGGDELCGWLFPHLRGLRMERIEPAGAGVVIEARSRAAEAACPACGTWSSRVHSGYARTVAGRPGRRPPGGDPPGGAAVLLPQPGVQGGHIRRAGRGPDRPVPAAEPAAAGVTGPDRPRAGRPGRGPAGRHAGRRGAPDHAVAPGRRLARARGQRRAGGPRGQRFRPEERARATGPSWWTSPPGRRSTCCQTGKRAPWRPG